MREVLNDTISNYHLPRRIKYDHLACHRSSPIITCFYDEAHFFFFNEFGNKRVANCFEFSPMIKHDCSGQSNCASNAQCLQNRTTCPQTSFVSVQSAPTVNDVNLVQVYLVSHLMGFSVFLFNRVECQAQRSTSFCNDQRCTDNHNDIGRSDQWCRLNDDIQEQ